MSMMMRSAAKKKPKQGATRRSDSGSSGGCGCPPTSNSVTSIWYWELDGIMTTVMYTKDSDEIWCNGVTLYAETRIDSYMGKVGEFTIGYEETGAYHQAHLIHMDDGSFVLYVDGIPIPEHTG